MIIGCFSFFVYFSKQPFLNKPIHLEAILTIRQTLTLCCVVFLFIAFFVAMCSQGTADLTICQFFWMFNHLNQNWTIEEYDETFVMSCPASVKTQNDSFPADHSLVSMDPI